jgi:hypothetical protein
MFKKLLFLAFSCFGIRPAFAYYTSAQVWDNHQGTKYIITGEEHKTDEKNNKVALQQTYDLITWAKRLNAHVTVEDPFTTNSEKFTRDPFNYLNTEYCAAIPTLLTLNNQTALVNFSSLWLLLPVLNHLMMALLLIASIKKNCMNLRQCKKICQNFLIS